MNIAFIDNRRFTSFIISCLNCGLLSDKISLGIPNLEKMFIKFSATVTESIFLGGMASGNLVAQSIKVSMYLCPRLNGVNSPTRSMATLVNGSLMMASILTAPSLLCPQEKTFDIQDMSDSNAQCQRQRLARRICGKSFRRFSGEKCPATGES